MMYDNLSNRLRGEAKASDASPYIKELMRQAADAIDHFENLTRAFQSLSSAPTIIPPKEKPTCKDCQRECQMMGLDMEACASYEPPKEET